VELMEKLTNTLIDGLYMAGFLYYLIISVIITLVVIAAKPQEGTWWGTLLVVWLSFLIVWLVGGRLRRVLKAPVS